MLQKGSYVFYRELKGEDKKKYADYPRDRRGRVLNKNTGKPIRIPYKLKVFNTINFDKSLHYKSELQHELPKVRSRTAILDCEEFRCL